MIRRRRQEKEDEKLRQEKVLLNANSQTQKAINMANSLRQMVNDLASEVEQLNAKIQQLEENLAISSASVTTELEV